MTDVFERIAPLSLLDKSSKGGLGKGNLGAVLARAGAGKTACLISLALGKMMRGEKIVHVSLGETPDKVKTHYELIFNQIRDAAGNKGDAALSAEILEKNRIILAFLKQSFDTERFRINLENLTQRLEFKPEAVIIDGLNFEDCEKSLLEGLKKAAAEFGTEIWFSVRSHRHINEKSDRGIPFPLSRMEDLFTVILEIEQEGSQFFLTIIECCDNNYTRQRLSIENQSVFLIKS
ncbi:MAG: hypothetical protein COZ70_13240 [Deltaproteobacteria bacterium CG_4_8_14_3_um_filter_51_11]|nr:hypothetical protein [bacterium]OIP41237.1 MAG: hypothetical protein AUK25_06045 [Desulfobacteraceae bacterium CG2_30_51_40]PIP45588.1 MAG: hypothetical protein COX16_12355 [Deltaproteobacteria bacterium CG23_combo_of_CG06-09_8_20_14_all_51_20]PIX18609.1 MAG: hypothetical protein COZ70_13240 [Deltaproteobacteria bacterium CG_4_8_14_3_um_filter_51_11]PIY24777.1 MAG: hypothetical protein COZ11_06865 [Deltaproteobacteria bacterium CG_4_10_14_3_um_filter_51_14]